MLVKPRGGETERFDEVVLATHSDQALALLRDASDREHAIIGAIAYQPGEAVLHTDRPTERDVVRRCLRAATQEHPAGTILDLEFAWPDDLRARQLRLEAD